MKRKIENLQAINQQEIHPTGSKPSLKGSAQISAQSSSRSKVSFFNYSVT